MIFNVRILPIAKGGCPSYFFAVDPSST